MVPPLPIFTFWENVPPHFTVFCCLHPNFCSFKCVGAIRLKIRKKKDDDDDDDDDNNNNKYLPDLPAHQKQRNIRIHWIARSLMCNQIFSVTFTSFSHNRFVMFHNVRIPRENLLNKTGDLTPDGRYVTPFKVRFPVAAKEGTSNSTAWFPVP